MNGQSTGELWTRVRERLAQTGRSPAITFLDHRLTPTTYTGEELLARVFGSDPAAHNSPLVVARDLGRPAIARSPARVGLGPGRDTQRSAAVTPVDGWWARVSRTRRTLRRRLSQMTTPPTVTLCSRVAPHILAVRFPKTDHFALCERLWRDHLILTTCVGPMDLIRFQIGVGIHSGHIERLVNGMNALLPTCALD